MSVKKETDAVTAAEQEADAAAQAERIIAQAREKAAAIVADAERKAASMPSDAPAAGAKPPRRTVRITLFKDNDRYKDDVTVILNGRSWRIRRGVEVEVPESVARVLENSRRQDASTASLIERESAQFNADARLRGF